MKSGPAGSTPDSCGTLVPGPTSCVPTLPHIGLDPRRHLQESCVSRKHSSQSAPRREIPLNKDTIFEIWHDHAYRIISENYSYKSESYYSILRHELDGDPVLPSSSAVLEACIVPICLERAHLAGIPVCDWGISQGYVPMPSILYGINYFANTAEYFVVSDDAMAKEAIRHITNLGKYPFCYQKLPDGAVINTCVSVFGKTFGKCRAVEDLAEQVYNLFAIPLVTMVSVTDGSEHRLSSLSTTRYSQLSGEERAHLLAYLNHQEFL